MGFFRFEIFPFITLSLLGDYDDFVCLQSDRIYTSTLVYIFYIDLKVTNTRARSRAYMSIQGDQRHHVMGVFWFESRKKILINRLNRTKLSVHFHLSLVRVTLDGFTLDFEWHNRKKIGSCPLIYMPNKMCTASQSNAF